MQCLVVQVLPVEEKVRLVFWGFRFLSASLEPHSKPAARSLFFYSHIVSCVQAHQTSLELLRLRGIRRQYSCVSTHSWEFSLAYAKHDFYLRYQQFFVFFLKAEVRQKYPQFHHFMTDDEILPVSTLCSMYVFIYSKCACSNQYFGQGIPICLFVVSAFLPITNCCPSLLCSLKRNTAYRAEVFMRD